MPDFTTRSNQKEILDRDDIPFADISRNMQELEFINKYLGGHQITLSGLNKLIKSSEQANHRFHICEIGCGGGDNLKAIYNWGNKNGLQFSFTGIDINKECIQHAKQHCAIPLVQWIESDYKLVQFTECPDIIFSSLFSHHFTNEDLIKQYKWMKHSARLGFFVNDLHRHPLAFYSIKLLTRLFSKSYLVKNDAPLSVLRGFSKDELNSLLQQSGCQNPMIEWKWAFRWLITYHKQKGK